MAALAEPTLKKYRISPSTGLSLMNDCPKCFWLHYNASSPRPRGIFPSLPGGMDLVIKDHYDQYRGALPPELEGKVRGVLMKDTAVMNRWRNWRTGLEVVDAKIGATLFGALDDCLVDGDTFIPLDYKTRGSAPIDGDSEKYYQTQLDTYALMLSANGFKTGDEGYLVYYYPQKVGPHGAVTFFTKPVKLGIDIARARARFEKAVSILRGPMPPSRDECEYCSFIGKRTQTVQTQLFR